MTQSGPAVLERVLRSAWGRWGLVAAVVAVVSLAVTLPRSEIAELRGEDVAPLAIFLDEALRWGVWGLAAWPILALARWILARSGSALILLLVQLPLSGAVAYGYLELDSWLHSGAAGEAAGLPGGSGGGRRAQERRGADGPPPAPAIGPGDEAQEPGRGPDARPPRPGDWPRREGDGEGRGRGAERRARWRALTSSPDWSSPFWRFRWIQAVFVYWVVLGLGAGVQAFLGLREKEQRAAELELGAERLRTQLVRAQVDTLRGQLHPHFLFNALHSVGGLVRAGEERAALSTLSAIGDLLRATLDHGDAAEMSLDEELGVAQRYLEIEKIRLGDRLQVDVQAEEGIGGARVPALLLLPLVENAVRHGIAPLPEGGVVRVRARREGPSLVVEVEDDGAGFPPELLAGGESSSAGGRRSIGLGNTRGRLLGLYGELQHFELANRTPRGASVRVVLPYHEEEWQG